MIRKYREQMADSANYNTFGVSWKPNPGILARTFLVLVLSTALSAGVVGVEIQSRSDVLGGRAFGLAGPYEKLVGKVRFAVDPGDRANRSISDIDKAPRNSQGQVEFSADVYILRPKHPARGNGAVLYEVPNRGGKGMLAFFNEASRSLDPTDSEDFGDGFLLKQGFSLVWLGWQWDTPQRPGLLRLYAPRVTGLKGLVRTDFVPAARITSQKLSDRDHLPYLVADPADPTATLTVRDRADEPRRAIPRSEWRFSPDRDSVEMPRGFDPHRIYELVYTAENPALVGLGLAAVRDFFSYLKAGAAGSPLDGVERAYAFGISQSARFLRTLLYYGFNQDENREQVFDGMMPHVSGAGRGSFNHRFAQPSRDGHPFSSFLYPSDIFPFTDLPQTDPVTGWTGGLLDTATESNSVPRILYTCSSYEYWGRAMSLIHTSINGRTDASIPDSVRIYFMAGGQHGPAGFPPRRTAGKQRSNPNNYRWAMRALLLSLDRWVRDGTLPPPSVYPRIASGTLVSPTAVHFPKIPSVVFPERAHLAYRADYGPSWNEGIVTNQPPKMAGKPYPILVPQVDDDGIDQGGLKMPEVAVPLATYTGWNQFNGKTGPAHELTSGQGSYIPFPRTRAERDRTGDPRPSIEERYGDKEQYFGMVSGVSLELIERGYLLPGDLPAILKEASERWNWATDPQRPD